MDQFTEERKRKKVYSIWTLHHHFSAHFPQAPWSTTTRILPPSIKRTAAILQHSPRWRPLGYLEKKTHSPSFKNVFPLILIHIIKDPPQFMHGFSLDYLSAWHLRDGNIRSFAHAAMVSGSKTFRNGSMLCFVSRRRMTNDEWRATHESSDLSTICFLPSKNPSLLEKLKCMDQTTDEFAEEAEKESEDEDEWMLTSSMNLCGWFGSCPALVLLLVLWYCCTSKSVVKRNRMWRCYCSYRETINYNFTFKHGGFVCIL